MEKKKKIELIEKNVITVRKEQFIMLLIRMTWLYEGTMKRYY